MAGKMKGRVRTSMAPKGFKTMDDRGPRYGEQGKGKPNGYSGGAKKLARALARQQKAEKSGYYW